jgi:hypothetical protein
MSTPNSPTYWFQFALTRKRQLNLAQLSKLGIVRELVRVALATPELLSFNRRYSTNFN